ncbi:MAG: MFS transporter [Candidatus Aminicenantales bacterium]
MGEANGSFWSRPFLVALFGYFFLFMSISLFFIFPLFLQQFNPSQSRVGLIMGIHSFMAIAVRPVFGRLIDEVGRRRVSLSGLLLLIIIMPLFHFIRDAGLFPLILRALTGLGWGISMTATITICSDLAPIERLAHSMGIIGVAGLIASALGPLLAEEAVRRFGFAGLFNLSLLFLLASLACILATRETGRPPHSNNQTADPLAKLRDYAPLIILLMASLPIIHGAVRGAMVNFVALFSRSIGLQQVGPFFVTFSLAAILTRFWGGSLSDRYGRKKVIFPAATVIGLNVLFLSQVKAFWMLLVAGFIGGFGQGLIFPALSTYVIDTLGRENKGFALSLYLSLFDAGMGLGSPFFGWLSDLFGYRAMYILAGATILVFNLVFALKAPAASSSLKPESLV